MKKLRPKKSTYASGSAQRIRIDGAKKSLSREELRGEIDGLLRVLASLVEENRGPLSVSLDTMAKVGKEGRILQVLPGQMGVIIKFKEVENNGADRTEETIVDTAGSERFYDSDAAREAREYLQHTRDSDTRAPSQ